MSFSSDNILVWFWDFNRVGDDHTEWSNIHAITHAMDMQTLMLILCDHL